MKISKMDVEIKTLNSDCTVYNVQHMYICTTYSIKQRKLAQICVY